MVLFVVVLVPLCEVEVEMQNAKADWQVLEVVEVGLLPGFGLHFVSLRGVPVGDLLVKVADPQTLIESDQLIAVHGVVKRNCLETALALGVEGYAAADLRWVEEGARVSEV